VGDARHVLDELQPQVSCLDVRPPREHAVAGNQDRVDPLDEWHQRIDGGLARRGHRDGRHLGAE